MYFLWWMNNTIFYDMVVQSMMIIFDRVFGLLRVS
ncbi:MAG: putative Co/Zn/Cd cation transporter (cation efflux family), partial [Planctomycetota bacterium]